MGIYACSTCCHPFGWSSVMMTDIPHDCPHPASEAPDLRRPRPIDWSEVDATPPRAFETTMMTTDRAAFETHMLEGNRVLSRRQEHGYVAHSDHEHYRTWQAALRYARQAVTRPPASIHAREPRHE